MKMYVGIAKAAPDSRTPRRFIVVRSSTDDHDRDRRLVALAATGSRDAAYCAPDEIDTATVST